MAGPADAEAEFRRAGELARLGRAAEAEAGFARALALAPRHPAALWNLGLLMIERAAHDEALALADAALAEDPAHARARLLRGDALAGLGRHEETLAAYAPLLNGDLAYDAWAKSGLAQAAMGRMDDARAALDRAVAIRPGDPFAPFRRGIVRLQAGDFGGWSDYEARWRLAPHVAKSGGVVTPDMVPRLTLSPTREDLAGQRVLVLGEQGIGDQVMFASMLPDLARVAASVTCVCDARLARLFAASFPGVDVASPQTARIAPDAIDRIVAIGSLGGAFRGSAADFPGAAYLAPGAEARARWAARLGPRTGRLRIGLAWRGGLPTTRRRERSLDLAQLGPILDLPGVEAVSLQHGDAGAEIAAANATLARPIRAFDAADTHDFEDLAALVSELDLVVSVQTALVHLTGALGRPALVMLPHVAEWRYGAAGETMPWYGSARLFRQPAPGDWASVVAAVAEAVGARL